MEPTLWNRVSSSIGTPAVEKLHQARVAIVGLGSLGSQAAVLLGMSGVGNFTLLDPDLLEAHNVVRHAAGLRFVNQPKVEAVRQLLLDRNPNCRVEPIQGDARRYFDELDSAPFDLVLVAGLGSEEATATLGYRLRDLHVPALYGGLYEKAIAGEVFHVHESKGPCYGCFASMLREATVQPKRGETNYGLPPDEVKAQPGLGIHVARVASVFADWAVRSLIADPTSLAKFPGNLVILSNESYSPGEDVQGNPIKMSPASSWWLKVRKNSQCLICGLSHQPTNVSLASLLD